MVALSIGFHPATRNRTLNWGASWRHRSQRVKESARVDNGSVKAAEECWTSVGRMFVVATDTVKELPTAYPKRQMSPRALETRPAFSSDQTVMAPVGPPLPRPMGR